MDGEVNARQNESRRPQGGENVEEDPETGVTRTKGGEYEAEGVRTQDERGVLSDTIGGVRSSSSFNNLETDMLAVIVPLFFTIEGVLARRETREESFL